MSCLITLKRKGLKFTPQRKMIIDVIHEAKDHLIAEDIIAQVQDRMPQVHKSTIYRTLELLEDAGSIFKSELDGHFIYHHAAEGHHHHLVCRECGKVVECDEDHFTPAEESIADKYGFHVGFKHLVISGICQECRNKRT